MSHLASVQEGEPQPGPTASGSFGVAPARETVVRTRPDLFAGGVVAEQEGGGRQPIEILRLERG